MKTLLVKKKKKKNPDERAKADFDCDTPKEATSSPLQTRLFGGPNPSTRWPPTIRASCLPLGRRPLQKWHFKGVKESSKKIWKRLMYRYATRKKNGTQLVTSSE